MINVPNQMPPRTERKYPTFIVITASILPTYQFTLNLGAEAVILTIDRQYQQQTVHMLLDPRQDSRAIATTDSPALAY